MEEVAGFWEGQHYNDSHRGECEYPEPEFRFPELLALEVKPRTCCLVDRALEECLENTEERLLLHPLHHPPVLLSFPPLPLSHRCRSSQGTKLGSLCFIATSHQLSIYIW